MTSVEKILTDTIDRDESPSVQYLFFDQSRVLTSFQRGFANIAKQKRVDERTTWNAFSVTKTFTALAILQLAEKGALDIDKPVVSFLPGFRYGAEITIRQLVTHTAGLPNPVPLSWIHLHADHAAFDRDAFFAPIFAKNSRVLPKRKDKFAYSNLGYVVLGQLIENVSGQTYEQYIVENIVQKLSLGPDDLAFTSGKNHATGYHRRFSFSSFLLGFFLDKAAFLGGVEGRWRRFHNFYVNGASYGGLIGTANAFVCCLQELLRENSTVIGPEYKKILFQEEGNTGMCFSWFCGRLNGVRYCAHPGGGGGYYCEVRIYPDIGKGSVIFFNRTGMRDERCLDRIDRFSVGVDS